MKTAFVTGSAGFIGMHLSRYLLEKGYQVVGLDNFNDYYDVSLKRARNQILQEYNGYHCFECGLEDAAAVSEIFSKYQFDVVVNLAAQAGVRYSIENPRAYIDSNVVGFLNILEGCRYSKVPHLVFASSSSVYGANTKIPFSETDSVDHPVSLYAATKKSNELMAHSYASLYKLPVTGLRFFTVYGPYGRPDMAYYLFADAIMEDKPIKVFNNGLMKRDFTYVDDIVEGIYRLIENGPAKVNEQWSGDSPDTSSSYAPYRIYNIGNNQPEELETLISCLEESLGKKAIKEYYPMQAGDVLQTYADIDSLYKMTGYKPQTDLKEGIRKFSKWYMAGV